MNAGRWYPTATTLANGDMLVVSGSIDNTVGENLLPGVFQAGSSTWRHLTNAQISLDLYPRMHLAPNGRVFNSAPSTVTRYLDTPGTGVWTVVANRSANIYRDYGSSVMYDDGKVLVMGGGDPPTNTAEVIDLNAPKPAWRSVASMAFVRRQLNATLLPDGKVLVTGGTSGPGFNNTILPVFAAEIVGSGDRKLDYHGERSNFRGFIIRLVVLFLTDAFLALAGTTSRRRRSTSRRTSLRDLGQQLARLQQV